MEGKKKISVVDTVVAAMLKAIEDGKFVPKQKIPSEHALTKEFGVSRTALREAFQKLEQLGKLTIRQGDGTYINEPKRSNKISLPLENTSMSQYMESRELLEHTALPLVIERITEQEIDNLTHILNQQKDNIEDSLIFSNLDFEFHHALMATTKNNVLLQCWSVTALTMREQLQRICAVRGMKQSAFNYHQKLLYHIAQSECRKAQTILRRHFECISSRLYIWN